MRIAHTQASAGPRCFPSVAPMVALVLAWAAADTVRADQPTHVVVGTNASPAGALLAWNVVGQSWKAVAPKAEITAGQQLTVLAGDRGQVDAAHGAARLTLWGNVPQATADPLRDSTVVINPPGEGQDLSVTLRRGRLVFTNTRQRGPARIQLRFEDQAYGLILNGPGTEVAAEYYSRWLPGVPFVLERPGSKPDTANQARPLVSVVILVLKGQADISTGQEQFAMRAPPGPAAFSWDSFRGAESSPHHVNALPVWTKASDISTIEAKPIVQAVRRIRQAVAEKPVNEVLAAEMNSSDKISRDLAVDDMASVSDLAGLVQALTSKEHSDVRETAVEALRRWIGRGTDEDQRLYRFLVRRRQYSAVQAEIGLQLLHSFDRDAWYRPETYELLIGYLNNPKMIIRVLAAAHLYHSPFAPKAGNQISYDPAGSAQERARAVEQWRKAVPEGTIPKELRQKGR
ncbi:MAG TPA: hypothetical protein VFA18_09670 [Gemmataceae bacterium]|nr:hypothetical protein [Gemmataceae bacterium]